MKQLLTLLALIAFFSNAGAQFTSGRLAVVQVGDGTTALSSAAAPINIIEYNTNGTPSGFSVSIPSIGTNTVTMSGSATSEGALALSSDRNYLTFGGYNAVAGTAAVISAANTSRVITLLPSSGIPAYKLLPYTNAYSGNNFRSTFTTNGTNIWTAGTGTSSGIRYTTSGSDTSIQVSSTIINTRVVGVFNNQLYYSANSGTAGIYAVGTGTPTNSGNTATILFATPSTIGGTTNGSPYAFVMFDATGDGVIDLVYVADDGTTAATSGIRKFSFDGTIWTEKGTLQATAGTATPVRGLCATRLSNGSVQLYASGTSTIYSVLDATAYNVSPTATLTSIATATTNYVFRGISFTPATTIPVELMSFTATPKNDVVNVAWATASEKNCAFFAVERSAEGKNFQTIGKVTGNGNAHFRHDYSFTDDAALNGTSYYRLRQVDIDGTSDYSATVSVSRGNSDAKINRIYPSLATSELQIETQSTSNSTLTITDLSGRIILTKALIADGYNQSTLNIEAFSAGTYFVTLESGTTKVTEKFVKQ